MINFHNAVTDVTGGQYKVLKRDYLSEGRIPVIDQGQSFIAGYTNNDDTIFVGELPVILFGDHTLALKYVDFPFALGADGVKVLSIRSVLEPKYVYYYWQSRTIQSRGYSRHFKYLRDIQVPLIPISEQRRIVEILDQADVLRKKRAEADAKAARILPALFYKMFGDPATNSKGWPLKKLGDPQIAMINPKFSGRNISADTEFSFVPMADIDEVCGRILGRQVRTYSEVMRGFTTFQDNDVLFAKITPCMQNGKAAIARNLINGRGFGSTEFHVLRAGNLSTPEWLYVLIRLQWFKKQAESSFTGTVGQQRVPPDFLTSYTIGCPPIALQNKFTNTVIKFQELVDRRELSAARLENIFSNLLHLAFTGNLTAKWREAHMKELLTEMEMQSKILGTLTAANNKKESVM